MTNIVANNPYRLFHKFLVIKHLCRIDYLEVRYTMLVMDTKAVLELLDAIQHRMDLIREIMLTDTPTSTAAALAKVSAGLCTYCGKPTGDSKTRRGAHETTCYRKAMRRVEKGEITDVGLVAAGLLLPAERPGKRVSESDPVRQLIEKEIESVKKSLPEQGGPKKKNVHRQ